MGAPQSPATARVSSALLLARMGFRVFRCDVGEKKPFDASWKALATAEPDQLTRWFSQAHDWNIGLAMGLSADSREMRFAIDADVKGGGLESLALLEGLGLPETRTSLTPSGGQHRIFRTTLEQGRRIRNKVRSVPGYPGIDIRAHGGLIVAPGSFFGGRPYEWLDPGRQIAEAPDWLVDLLASAKARDERDASEQLVEPDTEWAIDRAISFLRHEAPEAIDGAGGDATTLGVAYSVRDFGVGRQRAFELIAEQWNEAGKASPPWLPEDLERKVDNAFAYAQNPFGIRHPAAEFEPVAGEDTALPKRKLIQPAPFVWRPPATIAPRAFVYGQHWARGYVSATVAHPGAGKTNLAVADALACVAGRNLIGRVPDGRLRVWFWNGEDPRDEMERRIHAAMIHHELGPDDLGDRLFLNSGRDDSVTLARQTRDGVALAMPEVENMVEVLIANRIDVAIIDPFISSHRVSENDNNAIDLVAKTWARIAHQARCAIDLVHHVRKTNGSEATVEDSRGASALLGAVRVARVVNGMTKDEAKKLGVENHFDFIRVSNGKANMSRRMPIEKEAWLRTSSILLGNGDDVGAVAEWVPADLMADLQPSEALAVQEAVDAGEWRKDPRSPMWVGVVIARVLKRDLDDESDRAFVLRWLKQALASDILVELEQPDAGRKVRTFVKAGKHAAF